MSTFQTVALRNQRVFRDATHRMAIDDVGALCRVMAFPGVEADIEGVPACEARHERH